MKIIYALIVFCLSFSVNAQSADEVIDRYFQVNGGRENMGKNLRNTKEVYEVNIIEIKKTVAHTEFKNEFGKEKSVDEWEYGEDSGKAESVEIFNGKNGYTFTFMNQSLVQSEEWDSNKIVKKKNESSLLDACKSVKEYGDSAIFEGIEVFNSKKCFKIKYVKNIQNYDTTSEDKNLEYHFFDLNTSLEIGVKNFDKNDVETISIIEEFLIVNGLSLPKKTLLVKNGKLYATMILKELLTDFILPEKEFEKATYFK